MTDDTHTSLDKDRPKRTEWSHYVDPDDMARLRGPLTLDADDDARTALARRFQIQEISSLTAALRIQTVKAHILHVTGTFTATVIQSCVLTDTPVTETLSDTCDGWFADPSAIVSLQKARRNKAAKDGGEFPILDESEDPEALIDGKIDAGELVAQSLSLALSPYPRADNAELPSSCTPDDANQPPAFSNPFAALKDWKKDQQTSE